MTTFIIYWTKYVNMDKSCIIKFKREDEAAMSSTTLTRRREVGRERRDRTRNRLLTAAARVLAELGEHKAKIDDFIQAAGVARGTFYNYYSTKAELLEDLWASSGRDPFRTIQRACEAIADPAERIGLQTRLVLAYAGSHPTWGWLVYALSVDADTINSDLMTFPRPDLIHGRTIKRFSFSNLDSASDMVVGTVRCALKSVLSDGKGGNYADEVCLMLLRGLGVPEADTLKIIDKDLPNDLPIVRAVQVEQRVD